MMWGIILLLVVAAFTGMIIYLVNRIRRFTFIKNITKENKKKENIASLILILVIFIPCLIFLNVINAIIILLHFGVFLAICDLIGLIIKKITNKSFQNLSSILAIVLTISYLGVAWYLAHNVWQTNYVLDTDKKVGHLKIVQFADSHIGATFNSDGFAKEMQRIQELNPDVVLLTGDFVDDDSTREDMIGCCKALGELKTTFGVYYCFGNHDKGYYGSEHRGFSANDLVNELTKNGVHILQDETTIIDGRFAIIGRQDKSEDQKGNKRAQIQDLTKNLKPELYTICLDHQPNDYTNEAKANVDLVLSGHTHGGQLIPINYVGEWIGANDKTYGYEKRDNTNFIVTSGISDWSIKFKTGCKSEFVVIDINGK